MEEEIEKKLMDGDITPSKVYGWISEAYKRIEVGKTHLFDTRGFCYHLNFENNSLMVFTDDKGRAIGKGRENIKRLAKNTGMRVEIKSFKERFFETTISWEKNGKSFIPHPVDGWEWKEVGE